MKNYRIDTEHGGGGKRLKKSHDDECQEHYLRGVKDTTEKYEPMIETLIEEKNRLNYQLRRKEKVQWLNWLNLFLVNVVAGILGGLFVFLILVVISKMI